MSAPHFTEAEWRAQCAREWPHLPPADFPPVEPKAPLETKGLSPHAMHQPFTDASWRVYCAQQWPHRTTGALPVHTSRKGAGRIRHSAPRRTRRTR